MVITEIVSRSRQGTTLPFLCRADDGLLYFLKGRFAGRRSLCAEWIAGRLGILYGLPIPRIAIATIPESLIKRSARFDTADLGSGPVFASQFVEDAQELNFVNTANLRQYLRQDILLFDWWIHNEDRTLSEFGGNPNLIWSPGKGIQVVDHNLAFDDDFDSIRFKRNHIFAGESGNWRKGFREGSETKLNSAVTQLPAIWSEIPKTWLFEDSNSSLPPCLNYDDIYNVVNRFRSAPNDFWTLQK